MTHIPVLLNEVIKFLDPKPGNIILDATIDGGGHAKAILEMILPDGVLIGIDQDKNLLDALNDKFLIFPDSRSESRILDSAKQNRDNFQNNIILSRGNFRDLDKILESSKINYLDGVIYDLGMSSFQLEESGRGFTFLKDEPLLMTYEFPVNPGSLTAKEILNTWPEKDIADILFKYGEERYGRRIARNIVFHRQKNIFRTTFDLVEVIKKSVPHRPWQRISPATKTFQALRIAVNDELAAFNESLEKVWKFLVPGSRIVIISFHSLEDRIAKNFLKNKEREGGTEIKTKKPVTPLPEEISSNPRARSAKLRAAIKIFRQEADQPRAEK